MTQYINTTDIPLSLAVFLATDNYDYSNEATHISATSLLKSVRQLILSSRVPTEDAGIDLGNMISSRMGSAIHDAIESAWVDADKREKALQLLGYPKSVINRIRINPSKEELQTNEDIIPVYLELRSKREIDGFTVSGKFDFVAEGRVEDFKTTSTYTVMNNTKDADYILQGSIYHWLNPEIITSDTMAIQFIFTDWSAAKARTDPNYPQKRFQTRVFNLLSLQETESYIRKKLALISKYWNADAKDIPECTDAELWRSEPVWKYYKNPEKLSRSTKNFDSKQEAYIRLAEDGGVGIIKEVPGQVVACKYCSAFTACNQKDSLISSGDLIL